MRLFLVLWLAPSTLFWSWHLLSIHDLVFPRELHDRIFLIYGHLLDLDPSEIPSLFAHAFATDSLLILAVVAFRRRKELANLLRSRFHPAEGAAVVSIDANRSSAP